MHFTYCIKYTLFFSKNQAKTLKSTIFFTPIFIPFLSIPKTYFTPQKQTFKPSSTSHFCHPRRNVTSLRSSSGARQCEPGIQQSPDCTSFKPSSLTHSRHHTYKQTFKPSSLSNASHLSQGIFELNFKTTIISIYQLNIHTYKYPLAKQ